MRYAITAAICALFLGYGAGSAAAQDAQARARRRMSAVASDAGIALPEGALDAPAPPVPPGEILKRYVVIFKGPTICDGCETPFEDFFHEKGYEVREVKPGESTPALLARAAVYIVPGGEDVAKLEDGWTEGDREAIRAYVSGGGRYYGSCLGGYWAGKAGTWPTAIPGFEALDLIPATVLELSADDTKDKVVGIHWDGQPRQAYFQDGPSFVITDPSRVLKIYATYDDNHHVAAFSSRYGQGKVAVCGVHPEATQDWYDEYHLPAPKNLNRDLLEEILDDLMEGPAVSSK
jgi:glutamine amidotransferase-like uncharacterized protein